MWLWSDSGHRGNEWGAEVHQNIILINQLIISMFKSFTTINHQLLCNHQPSTITCPQPSTTNCPTTINCPTTVNHQPLTVLQPSTINHQSSYRSTEPDSSSGLIDDWTIRHRFNHQSLNKPDDCKRCTWTFTSQVYEDVWTPRGLWAWEEEEERRFFVP